MKTLLLSNQKGGVGKSAVACQFAHYLADKRGLRVLFIDLDHQGNSTKALRQSGAASVSDTTSSMLLTTKGATVEHAPFVLVPSDSQLLKMEKQAAEHNAFAGNFKHFLGAVDSQFDACVIDTNPNPDIRMVASLVSADFVLAPIQLNQEAIDGIGALMRDVRNVKDKLNPKLHLLGILPNQVANTPFQRANLEALVTHYNRLLLQLGEGRFAFVRSSTAVAEAQAEGKPLWKLGKTSARDAWKELEPIFNKIAVDMGVTA